MTTLPQQHFELNKPERNEYYWRNCTALTSTEHKTQLSVELLATEASEKAASGIELRLHWWSRTPAGRQPLVIFGV
jgi:hypothetical protein